MREGELAQETITIFTVLGQVIGIGDKLALCRPPSSSSSSTTAGGGGEPWAVVEQEEEEILTVGFLFII
jgi:hypothetical protein